MARGLTSMHHGFVKKTKRNASLPIGRTARVAFEMDVMRAECCKTAHAIMNEKHVDELELDDCARLDDALAEAQRILKATVRSIMLSRIGRNRRGSRAR
jgi:hypothetical protein